MNRPTPYSCAITRANPTAFVILLDQSGSMSERTHYEGMEMTKAQALAMATNALLDELIDRCRRGNGLNDYYHIAVIGYSGRGVCNLLGNDGFVTPSELASRTIPTQVITRERTLPDGSTVITTTPCNRWVEPFATGVTPMYEALARALQMVEMICSTEQFRASYPPTIINITDGEATDATCEQLLGLAERIRNTSTLYGQTLLMNINLCKEDTSNAVIFPSSAEELPENRYAQMLYEMSSELPSRYTPMIMRSHPTATGGPFRAMGYNALIGDAIAIMNIGTITSM
ncbi:MAG: VWA domain-containing protein [Rikenellaceae bacterium]|nr:VWA domain-containing protein [Rikenellaceae bacterium]